MWAYGDWPRVFADLSRDAARHSPDLRERPLAGGHRSANGQFLFGDFYYAPTFWADSAVFISRPFACLPDLAFGSIRLDAAPLGFYTLLKVSSLLEDS